MKKIQLEAKLKDKTLSVNGRILKLDDFLFDADYFNRDDVDYLELKYDNEKYIAEEEAEKIYHFLMIQNLPKPIEVSQSPEEVNENSVTLYGEFKAKIYE